MAHDSLNEETIKRLPAPSEGNRVTYFAGATIQGAKAPRGFGVRVTAAGARPSSSTTAFVAENIDSRSAPGPIGPRSKRFVRLAICANASIEGRIHLRIAHHPQLRRR